VVADIPNLTAIGVATFKDDRHTIVKTLGKNPYDHGAGAIERYQNDFASPKFICIKAVDESCEIVGFAQFWCVGGVERSDVCERKWVEVFEKNMQDIKSWKSDVIEKPMETEAENATPENDPIESLKAIESASMKKMQKILTPTGVRGLIFSGVSVSPAHQGRGIGTYLLKYVCEAADLLSAYTWIHTSEEIQPLCHKMGFEVIEELPVDLDEFAPRQPSEDEERRMVKVKDGKWGVYTIRYMRRASKEELIYKSLIASPIPAAERHPKSLLSVRGAIHQCL
jgi:GNAT superfamily N-acetyltransferase